MTANLQSLRGLQPPFELGVPRIRFLRGLTNPADKPPKSGKE
jgi:hypothetical protein